MILLDPVQLTASSRPVLLPGEVEYLLLDKVDLEFEPLEGGLPGQLAKKYKTGYVILTSHRTLWIEASTPPSGPTKKPGLFPLSNPTSTSMTASTSQAPSLTRRHCSLPVHAVRTVVKKTAYSLSGAKVRLHLEVSVSTVDHRPLSEGLASSTPRRTVTIALRCRGDSPEHLAAKLEELLHSAPSSSMPTATPDKPAPPSGPLPPPAQPPPQPTQPPPAHVDSNMLMTLTDMGFPRNKAARSLAATQSKDLQAALDYLICFGHLPEMDQPLPSPASPAPHSPVQQQHPLPSPVHPLGAAPSAASIARGMPPMSVQGGRLPTLYSPSPPSALQAPTSLPQQQSPYQPYQSYPHLPPRQQQPIEQSLPWMMSRFPDQEPATVNTVTISAIDPGGAKHSPGPVSSETEGGGGSAGGIGGIIRREQLKSSQAGRSLSVAFQDLSALMTMAEEMVTLASKFRAVSSSAEASQNADGNVLDAETQADLISMGISSPVTKETAGTRYHVELCRQLADFLLEPLARTGGLMPLTDVYCLFNRARGTELVSPDDLLAAALLFQKVGLALQLRTFPSGLTTIQSAAHSDDAVCAAIAQMVQPKQLQQQQVEGVNGVQMLEGDKSVAMPPSPFEQGLDCVNDDDRSARSAEDVARFIEALLGPGVTAPDVARVLHVATAIAVEHLFTAETRGVVCRDEGPEGTRFFRNFFKDERLPLLHSSEKMKKGYASREVHPSVN